MSYILEALKRADAERQRGGVPGLHAQTGSGVTAVEPGHAGGRPWLLAGAALALLLIGGAVAWWWRAGPVATPVGVSGAPASPVVSGAPPSPVALPPMPGPVTTAPALRATAAPAAAVSRAPTAAVLRAPAAAVLPAPAAAGLRAPAAAVLPAPAVALNAAAPAASAVPATLATAAPAAVAAAPVAAVPERLLQLGELPDALRREVGPLNPGGSIYAEQAGARMVILNGQVFREGDLLAAQLRVEQIRPRSVVLSLRGQRFELAL